MIKRLEGPIGMAVAVVAGVLLVTLSAGAATTISTSITTGGALNTTAGIAASTTLQVLGVSTLSGGILVNSSSSTVSNLDMLNSTSTNATSTSFWVSNLASIFHASSSVLSANEVSFGGSATATVSKTGVVSFPSTFSVAATSTLATTTVARLLTVGSTTPQHATAELLMDGPATTTLQLSTSAAITVGTCIQMKSSAGSNVRLFVGTLGTTLTVEAGSCK